MIKTTRSVYNSSNKRILEFPINTSLDNIISDLWNDIIKYMDFHPFVIASIVTNIPGYRPMKKEEFDGKKFMDHYFDNDGIKNMVELKHYQINLLVVEEIRISNKFNIGEYGIRYQYRESLNIELRCDMKLKRDSEIILSKKLVLNEMQKLNKLYSVIWVPDI